MYGPVIGLNAQILKDFVDYNAYYRLANNHHKIKEL
jgi:hypothetical protein